MNTPAHLAASLIVWKDVPNWRHASAVTLGAFLPDLPMYGFYLYQKLVGSTEQQIWTHLYFQPHWQLFFDLFNSIPIACVIWAFCRWRAFRFGELLALSALLHMLCDLPVHHDDGHCHFLPLSDWRFRSPISYWDPQHYGMIVACIEFLGATVASGYVAFQGGAKSVRWIAAINLALYATILIAGLGFLLLQ